MISFIIIFIFYSYIIMTMNITNGDCLTLMKELPDKSIDLFICDLPYGETNCKWDCVIDLDEFWKEFKRLRKSKRTACIHFCSTKFGYTLIKSNEKMFKMDMVWKKRNKTGGLQSRHRPMRNHEMVYFFYEQAPKYNRDKYHKRIQAKPAIEKSETAIMGKEPVCKVNFETGKYFEPPNPLSVLEEEKYSKEHLDNNRGGAGTNEQSGIFSKENIKKYNKENGVGFTPPNPASVVEEKDTLYNKNTVGWSSSENNKTYLKANPGFTPSQPGSVVEEKDEFGWDKSVVIEHNNVRNFASGGNFEPVNPVSVLEELIEPAEDEPKSMFESKKVFIGKRHHQTEKPLDILEFFIKYWSDEGQTILDPTMGSGSTGVACKTLKRNFIGYEMDEKIFKVAEGRIEKASVII